MKREFADILTAYLMGWKNIRDCAEWLSGIDWNIGLDTEVQKFAGRMELLVTEILEGIRPEVEFWKEAARFVANESGTLYIQPMSKSEVTTAAYSNTKNSSIVEITVEAGAVAEESQSWSILPLLVSA